MPQLENVFKPSNLIGSVRTLPPRQQNDRSPQNASGSREEQAGRGDDGIQQSHAGIHAIEPVVSHAAARA